MRVFVILAWCIVLFIGTCVHDLKHVLTDFKIVFDLHPRSIDFWQVSYKRSAAYIIQKVGHFSGFFVLSALASNFGRYKSGLFFAIGYGVLTELIQPFFNRDGRVLDMFIDAAGATLAYLIAKNITSKKMQKFK